MSSGAKFIIAVVVLVLVLFGGWYWFKGKAVQQPADTNPQTQATTSDQTAQQTPPLQNLITSNETTDAALASDLSAIDSQMSIMAQDSSQVDSSLNDKSSQ